MKNTEQFQSVHHSLFTEPDIVRFREGRHYTLYRHLGAHHVYIEDRPGVQFSVWAPSADRVSLIGDFNGWDHNSHPMFPRWDHSGIWELFVPGLQPGALYKFHIHKNGVGYDKADPMAFAAELPPQTASRVTASQFQWSDEEWRKYRESKQITEQPLSIYEIHLGSWRRVPEENDRPMTYRELAAWLPAYCNEMGFTYVELLPVMEHPFYGSWGYQVTSYFAPTARYGTPDDFRHLVNELHNHQVGVILDWVPSHFPGDAHGLYLFDGTHLFEHQDPRQGFHPDWQSFIFNYGRNEVRAFLIASALYWLDVFHIDGLRVDAVASMLYRDYSRKEGEWVPNEYGGRENLEAIAFLQQLNEAVHNHIPGAFTIAEESTAFPGVTRPVAEGGLGFDFKWMMGWMHDTLAYFAREPLFRAYHQYDFVFSMHYAYSEKFLLPLSHDEVVHGKKSLLHKMSGDAWQQAANLRALYAYMYGHPGGKLLFMGADLAEDLEWRHDHSLDWHLLGHPLHSGIQLLIADLNRLYTSHTAMYQNSYSPEGFEWIDFEDKTNSVFCWMRKGRAAEDYLLFVFNATPVVRISYRIGVPAEGKFSELLNTDRARYGGSDAGNGDLRSESVAYHGREFSVQLTLPPLSVIILKPENS
jgi:1,4-alpha-glucan branching enzyme